MVFEVSTVSVGLAVGAAAAEGATLAVASPAATAARLCQNSSGRISSASPRRTRCNILHADPTDIRQILAFSGLLRNTIPSRNGPLRVKLGHLARLVNGSAPPQ